MRSRWSCIELKFNTPEVTPEKFILAQPPGSHVIQMK